MAKIKVHEIAKELDVTSKEVLAFLQESGVEAKAAQSSIEDNDADKVRSHFGKGAVGKAAPAKAPAAKKAAEEAPAKPAEEAKKPAKAPEGKSEERKAAVRPAGAPQQKQGGEVPKKKKPIIIVTNNGGNQRQGGQRGNNNYQNGGQRNNQGGYNNNRNAGGGRQVTSSYGRPQLIKPSVKPSEVKVDSPYFTKDKAAQQPQRSDRNQNQQVNTADRTERVQSRDNAANAAPAENRNRAPRAERPSGGNYGQRPAQNGNRNAGPRQEGEGRSYQNGQRSQNGGNFGGRPGSGNGRGARPDGRTDNHFKKPGQGSFAAPAAPGKDGKPRDERRGNSQNKDKKNRKDLMYEDDEAAARNKNKAGRFIKPEKKVEQPEEQIKVITVPETIIIKDLADKMKMQPSVIIKKLFLEGKIVTVNTEVTFEEAENIAIDYEIMCEKEIPVDVIEELLKEDEEDESKMVKRPPVVCVMGHVDHGKTSLLDAIRQTNVTGKEAGGITQAIGAYTVKVNNEKITFLDTPGHEAFTAMRMRGANSTDIAILVVAADDGVMPQTVEAINHAKAAGVEIIVAINKIDKPSANVDKVKQELMEYELVPTDWGGSTEFVNVSAKSREGLDTLLETILLTAEMLELKANKKRNARGLVIEAKLDKGRGPVATVLVQKGTLKVGDTVSAGASYGKVRAMIDDKGKRVKEAGPSTPVEILGLSDVPEAGEVFLAHENDKEAKMYAETYKTQHKEQMLADTRVRMSLDDLYAQIKEGNLKELDLVVKADVQGSVEALKASLLKLSNDEIVVKCIHSGVGAITESDVSLASASNAIIIGFNVKPDAQAKATAERENVDIHLYDVIYQALDDVERHIKGMEAPVYEEHIIGHAEVRAIFKASAIGNIAGAYVMDGIFKKGCGIRISREGEQIYEGKLASLKRFKDDVKEVKEGFECGLVFEDFDKMQELDVVEAFEMVEVPRT